MIVKTVEVNGRKIWLSIDQFRVYSNDTNIISNEEQFLCYFKLTEPTQLIYGELFRDENSNPLIFDTPENAVTYAMRELPQRLR